MFYVSQRDRLKQFLTLTLLSFSTHPEHSDIKASPPEPLGKLQFIHLSLHFIQEQINLRWTDGMISKL